MPTGIAGGTLCGNAQQLSDKWSLVFVSCLEKAWVA